MLRQKRNIGGLSKNTLLGVFFGVLALVFVTTSLNTKTFAAPYDDATPQEQAYAVMYYNMLGSCSTPETSAQAIGSGRFFTDSTAYISGVSHKQSSGTTRCDDGGYAAAALQFFGYASNIEAYCDVFRSAGVQRSNGSDCITGTGDFNVNSGSAQASFRNAVGTKYFGNSGGQDFTQAAKYALWQETLAYYCTAVPLKKVSEASPDERAQATYTAKWYDPATNAIDDWILMNQPGPGNSNNSRDPGDTISTYTNMTGGSRTEISFTCAQLAQNMNNDADALSTWIRENPGRNPTDGGANAGNGSTTGEEDFCDRLGTTSVRWIMCPLFELMDGATSWMLGVIESLLEIDTDKFFSGNMQRAWETFRNFALALVVIAALVMVASQAFGFSFLDAYTVKKILPRLLIAIVGITLSWVLVKFAVQVSNDIGGWIDDIIRNAFIIDSANLPGGQNWVAAAGGGIVAGATTVGVVGAVVGLAFLPGGLGAIFATLGIIALALITGLAVLGIRAAIIGVCIVLAPLAIAAYILPGTKKLWDFWQNTLMTCLLMFPIVMGFIAMGAALSSIIGATDTGWTSMLSVIVYFAPYFMLPFAFKLAGGLMKTIFSIADDKEKGLFDRMRKKREGSFGRAKADIAQSTTQWRADKVGQWQQKGSEFNRSNISRLANRARARVVGGDNIEARMSAMRAARSKELNDQISAGDDSEIRALSVNKHTADMGSLEHLKGKDGKYSDGLATNGLRRIQDGQLQYKTLAGGWVNESQVRRAHARWDGDTFAQQASLAHEMSKASTEEQADDVLRRYHNLAQAPKSQGGWGMTESQREGTWIGAGFQNQNSNLSFKHSQSDGTLKGGGKSLVDEIYEKKGSYPVAQMTSHTLKKLDEAYDIAKASDDTETVRKITAITETFTSDLAGGRGGGMVDNGSGEMIPAASQQGQQVVAAGGRIVNTGGAAHVAERVRALADKTGVKWNAPAQGTPTNTTPPSIDPQN